MKLIHLVIVFGLIVAFPAVSSGTEETEETGSPDMSMESPAGGPESSTGEMAAGGIVTYTNLDDARTQAERAPVLLFFNASWCPTCRAAVADIASRQAELDGITVFLVDYDRERELKRRYGVSSQHTYVQIDASGEAVTLWNGGGIDLILYNVVREQRS